MLTPPTDNLYKFLAIFGLVRGQGSPRSFRQQQLEPKTAVNHFLMEAGRHVLPAGMLPSARH